MSKELFTVVSDKPFGGYACRGRKARAAAIAEARNHFEYQRAQAEAFLRTPDAELDVRVVRGVHNETLVEILEP